MLIALIACGALLIGVGLFGLVRPNALQRWVATMRSGPRYALAVGVRVLLGLFLLAVAPEARWPGPTRVLGIIALAAAAGVATMGPSRLDRLVAWWSEKPSAALRVASLAALALGAALVVDAL